MSNNKALEGNRRNRNHNTRTKQQHEKIGNWIAKIGIVICILLLMAEYKDPEVTHYGMWTAYSFLYGMAWLILSIYGKKKTHILYCCVLLICFGVFLIGFLKDLIG